ncbi:MAG: hypothetical protein Q8L78_08705 [Coxiellaceae bacterium]|nr:hypothetical protein [Coxiellaceae bacterium]
MIEKKILQQKHLALFEKTTACEEPYQRKPYQKPALLRLDTNTIAGGSTSNQLENSSGLLGS